MPGRDGTGPNGAGELTGRKLGPCNKEAKAEPMNFGRRGCGYGCGRGLGRRMGFRQTQNQIEQKE